MTHEKRPGGVDEVGLVKVETDLVYIPPTSQAGDGGSLMAAVASESTGGDARSRERRIFDAWLAMRKPTTIRAYLWTLDNFARRIKASSRSAAIAALCADHGRANEWMIHLVEDLMAEDKKPATINRYVTALKSMVRIANQIGIVTWTLAASAPRVVTYRDTSGPPREVVDALLAKASQRLTLASGARLTAALRDRALLWLMATGGFRRGELTSLDVCHVQRGGISILGKARAERETFQLPELTMAMLNEWVDGRAVQLRVKAPREACDALFIALDRNAYGRRLTENGIYYLTTEMEDAIESLNGRRWSPHKFRHFAITEAVDRKGLEVGAAFGRHLNASTTMKYIDNLEQKAATGAEAIEDGIKERMDHGILPQTVPICGQATKPATPVPGQSRLDCGGTGS